jgi:hypothetical protein
MKDGTIFKKGNKVYGPDTCVFVPREINNLFTKRNRDGLPTGVTKLKNRFIAQSNTGKGSSHLGSFKTIEEAFCCSKEAKENMIKEYANKWRGRIDERIYVAMINRKIEITD